MKKQIFISKIISLVMLTALSIAPLLPAPAASAASCTGKGVQLTLLPPWYKGLQCDSKGAPQIKDIRASILQIVMNLIEALFYIVGYVSLGMIIWGGFKYMMFGDNSSGMEAAKKTIQNAIIGLVISIFAIVIVNVVGGIF